MSVLRAQQQKYLITHLACADFLLTVYLPDAKRFSVLATVGHVFTQHVQVNGGVFATRHRENPSPAELGINGSGGYLVYSEEMYLKS